MSVDNDDIADGRIAPLSRGSDKPIECSWQPFTAFAILELWDEMNRCRAWIKTQTARCHILSFATVCVGFHMNQD